MNLTATFFAQLVVFLIFASIMAKYVWPPMMKALDERAEKIRQSLAAADQAKLELSNANRRVEEQLVQAREQVTQRITDAEKRSAALVEDAKARASAEAAKILADAQAQANQLVVQAREALREQVASLAVKGAEQILRREVSADVHADLLNRLKTEL